MSTSLVLEKKFTHERVAWYQNGLGSSQPWHEYLTKLYADPNKVPPQFRFYTKKKMIKFFRRNFPEHSVEDLERDFLSQFIEGEHYVRVSY